MNHNNGICIMNVVIEEKLYRNNLLFVFLKKDSIAWFSVMCVMRTGVGVTN